MGGDTARAWSSLACWHLAVVGAGQTQAYQPGVTASIRSGQVRHSKNGTMHQRSCVTVSTCFLLPERGSRGLEHASCVSRRGCRFGPQRTQTWQQWVATLRPRQQARRLLAGRPSDGLQNIVPLREHRAAAWKWTTRCAEVLRATQQDTARGQTAQGRGQGVCRVRRVKGRSAGEQFRSAVSPQCAAGLCAPCSAAVTLCHRDVFACHLVSLVDPPSSLTRSRRSPVRRRHAAEATSSREASEGAQTGSKLALSQISVPTPRGGVSVRCALISARSKGERKFSWKRWNRTNSCAAGQGARGRRYGC